MHYDDAYLTSILSSQDVNPTFSIVTDDNENNNSILLTHKKTVLLQA